MSYLQHAPLALRTTSPDVARSHLALALRPHQVRCTGSNNRLDFVHRRAGLPGLSLHRIRYGAPVWVRVSDPRDFYMLQLTLAGTTSLSCGEQALVAKPGSLTIVNTKQAFEKWWDADAEQVIVCADARLVERTLAADLGDSTPRRPVFNAGPVKASEAPVLFGMLRAICDGLEARADELAIPHVAASLIDAFASLMIHSLPHDHSQWLKGGSTAAPAYVRRAERYIEENADRDIGLADIARASGVHPRTLGAGFRRFRETTPTERLRTVRLDQARVRLLEADPSATVTSIAQDCGLFHLGRFASEYTRRFGELPSRTLSRARDARC